jgi:hypothetical protein
MTRLLSKRSLSGLSALLAALAMFCWLSGCGGGDDNGGVIPPPVVQTATVRGTVVPADNVAGSLGGATVSALGVGAAGVGPAQNTVLARTTADVRGNFVLGNIPVGDVTIVADTLNEANYGSQSIAGVHLDRNDDLALTITVLPVGMASPTVVYLSPNEATIDLHGRVKFNGSVASSTGMLSVTPSFFLTGAVGVVDKSGQFIGTQAGTGKVWAVCGTVQATADIEVTAPRVPQITSFFVSPEELTATGGKVSITLAANDGDGIAQARVEIYKPDGSIENVLLELDVRTNETYWLPEVLDGLGDTGRWLIIPANTNTPDALGHQEAQRYSLRVIVTDNSGASSQTDFVDVVVTGIDTPPPPL